MYVLNKYTVYGCVKSTCICALLKLYVSKQKIHGFCTVKVPPVAKIMAEAAELALGSSIVRKWKSYTREEKLKIVHYYYHNRRNLYQTCKKFSQNMRSVQRWVQVETKIRDSKKGSMCVKFQRSAQHPEMEEKLYNKCKKNCLLGSFW